MPSEEMVKEWFDTQHLHADMQHEPYYGGIVVIGAVEKHKQTIIMANGATAIRESDRQVFTPYVKVDTRIAYFWTLVQIMNINAAVDMSSEDKYVGVIAPRPQKQITNETSPYFNAHLPEGFFIYAARGSGGGPDGNVSRYICAQWSVAIYERQSYVRMLKGEKPMPILQGIGTKQTLMAKAYPDDNAIMKAETGAIGRALGVAGILVVGTGIATAEDMQEMQTNSALPIVNREGNELPAVVGPSEPDAVTAQRIDGPDVGGQAITVPKTPQEVDEERRQRATNLSIELKKFPESWERYLLWYRDERGFPSLTELTGPALQGAVVKLERELDAARNPQTEAVNDAAAPPAQ